MITVASSFQSEYASCQGIWTVKLCSIGILLFLTMVPANSQLVTCILAVEQFLLLFISFTAMSNDIYTVLE